MNGSTEGDHLLMTIRQMVRGRVPPAQEEILVELVARTVVTIMSDAQFYSHLKLVQDLQSRIVQLERALAVYQSNIPRAHPSAPSASSRKVVAKKVAAKKPGVRKVAKKHPGMNVKQFKRGASGQ